MNQGKMLFILIGGWRRTILTSETASEILRVIETYFVGYFGYVSVARILYEYVFGYTQTVVADELTCWKACVGT